MAIPHKERLQALGKIDFKDAPRLAIYWSKQTEIGWGKPVLWKHSGTYKDYEPTASPLGDVLFFNSNRPLEGSQTHEKNNIWYSRFKNGDWEQPTSLCNINTPEEEQSYPTLSKKGKLIYTTEENQNGKSVFALFETVFEGRMTEAGKRIRFPNFHLDVSDPWVSPKGDYLIFTAFATGDWQNTCDLYISFRKNGQWTKPIAMTELNSSGPDFSPTVSSNGKWIYYRKNHEFLKLPFKKLLKKYSKME
ncbi:PD40 domain-containing protein [Muricauda sp. CAU 1633]|uniref:TolB family protein n=1 Tax=Allomuricauda sp. CAU 1633 TaxID=2816036 RepID=UPI001A8C0FF1|nr:PD40 domain-containing protein [Muricauda sp. CAU 1633]MBO0323002.1 PD40 domain-containing protein [Muricauda sp. CAU 1633]